MSARGTLGKKPRRGPQVPGCGPSRGGARLAEHAGSGERGALEDPAGELDTRSLRRPRCGVGHQAGAIEAALAACLEQAAPLPNLFANRLSCWATNQDAGSLGFWIELGSSQQNMERVTDISPMT